MARSAEQTSATAFYRHLLSISLAVCGIASVFILVSHSVGLKFNPSYYYMSKQTSFDNQGGKVYKTDSTSSASDSSSDSIFTLARSGYSALPYFGSDSSDVLTYNFLNSYDAVVEPYANMELQVLSGDFSDSTDYYFKFTVCPTGSGMTTDDCESGDMSFNEDGKSTGTEVSLPCVPFDDFEFTVEVYDKDDNLKLTSTNQAVCMYVRRELRDLVTSDLKSALDAMHTLWSTSEEEGQLLYGSNFHNSTYFVEAHHFNAAWQDADHIHEGMGFLPQHVKMTNLFEQAMQAVDPSVALPYWDFTIDSESGTVVQDSTVFSDYMFGSIPVPVNNRLGFVYSNDNITAAAIPDGRWAYIKADLVPSKFEGTQLSAAYGYLRAPWNMNPSPYVSRFSSYSSALPGCSDYYRWAKNTDLTAFMEDSPYGPHAATHGVIGSVYGCDLFDPLREAGLIDEVTDQLALCAKWGFYMKELYRLNYIAPQESCERPSTDDPASPTLTYSGMNCGFTCNEKTMDLMSKQLSKVISSLYVHDGGLTDDQWEQMRDFICTGDGYKIFVGDHLESASPSDPSFWPIHPTMERLLQAKLMSGGFDTYTWSSDPDDGYVCDKSSCYEYEQGSKDEYTECCYGHYENDQLLDFVNADKSSGYGLTNAQVMAFTDPTDTLSYTDSESGSSVSGYKMTYVYQHFDWSHCASEDFDGLFASLAKSSSSTATKTMSGGASASGSTSHKSSAGQTTPVDSSDTHEN